MQHKGWLTVFVSETQIDHFDLLLLPASSISVENPLEVEHQHLLVLATIVILLFSSIPVYPFINMGIFRFSMVDDDGSSITIRAV